MKANPRLFLLVSLVALGGVSLPVWADTVPEESTETILAPVLSPISLRIMGVTEFVFLSALADDQFYFKCPGAFLPDQPRAQDQKFTNPSRFGLEEFTLVLDGVFGKTDSGFHSAVFITGAGSKPNTLTTPVLIEGWGYFRWPGVQISAGRVRNPFGGRFSDLPEYHLHAVDYRRFRGDGLRLDFDLGKNGFHFLPSLAVMDRNPYDDIYFYSARLGGAVTIAGFGGITFGMSAQYGEDIWAFTNINPQNNLPALDSKNIRRFDYGFDLGLLWRHSESSGFGDTELHAEFISGSYNDDTDAKKIGSAYLAIGERKPVAWWLEFSQMFNLGAGGGPFIAFGSLDRKITKPPTAWNLGEQRAINELVIGYRQAITRGFNLDLELWIVADDVKVDPASGNQPDLNGDGENDLKQGNFIKLRAQFIF